MSTAPKWLRSRTGSSPRFGCISEPLQGRYHEACGCHCRVLRLADSYLAACRHERPVVTGSSPATRGDRRLSLGRHVRRFAPRGDGSNLVSPSDRLRDRASARPAARSPDVNLRIFRGYDRRARARAADAAERVLGAAGAALVWPDRWRNAVRGGDGHGMVCGPCDRRRRPQYPADLRARRTHHGIGRPRQVDSRDPAGIASLCGQRHEAGLGVRLAIAYGGRNLRHHPDRIRSRPSPELSAMDQVIGVMIVIVLIGLMADKILFSPWERFLHRRWGTGLK